MADRRLKTPVAFLIFNRPHATEKVFEAIRQARPPKLLVVADGPRPNRPGEEGKCREARAIIDRVDWPCEVLTNYSDTNLGCRNRISSGLDWVFGTVEGAIILEDDCLPHPTFFRFCEELLDRYSEDERVMMISGDNFQFGKKRTDYSYYFSCYNHIWGWASWRRAWKHYDRDMKLWPGIRDGNWMADIHHDEKTRRYWKWIFEKVHRNRIDTWDYQLIFASWIQRGVTILPNGNLITNIGFGKDSVHTKKKNIMANIPSEPMQFPLKHPPFVIRDIQSDEYEFKTIFNPGFLSKIKMLCKRSL